MDSTICGLNKVICYALSDDDNGQQVTITNGINTWTATIANKVAAFLIPSIPVPARKAYTVSFGDFERDIQMGYGDIIEVTLADGYENIKGADLLSLDEMNEEGADLDYKGVEAAGIKEIYDDIQDRTVYKDDDGTEYKFDFAVDSSGRYGYVKGGSIVPFRTGQETLCYSLGQGTSFDIKAACTVIHNTYGIDLDYTKLTNSNFIAVPNSDSKQKVATSDTNNRTFKDTLDIQFTAASVSYNQTTGNLTVSGGTSYAKYTRQGTDTGYGGSWDISDTCSPSIKAYIIVSMN